MPKFIFSELVDLAEVQTARLGAGTAANQRFTDADVGKLVRLVADSRYDLCGAATEIEGRVSAIEVSSQDGYSIGSVQTKGRVTVTFNGLQASAGTGAVAVGDYVLASTQAALNAVQSTPPNVVKATAAGNTLNSKWRVVSLGSAGTGAVGTVGLIERV